MLKFLIQVLLLPLYLFGSLHNGVASESPSTAMATRLKAALEKNTFKNVCFDFSTVERRNLDGKGNLSVTGWCSGRMYVNGQPNSLVKVTYAPNTMRWVDGAAPYYQENKTIAYNGKYWICEITDSGAINAMHRHPEAVITKNCPKDWEPAAWTTGEIFFVTYAPFYNNLTVAQTVKDLSWLPWLPSFLRGPSLHITNDQDIFKISIAPPGYSVMPTEIWLDMQKGGALKKLISKGKECTEEITVDSFQEVNGIWFPTKGTRILKGAGQETRLEFSASNFSIVDTVGDLYDVKLESGCRVQDMRR